jgi:uncharacterized protein YuzE
MRMTYDARADAAYIYLVPIGRGEVQSGHLCFPPQWRHKSHVGCHFNAERQLIGIEILNASKVLPEQALREAEQIARTSQPGAYPKA